jgi:hypothetical protein
MNSEQIQELLRTEIEEEVDWVLEEAIEKHGSEHARLIAALLVYARWASFLDKNEGLKGYACAGCAGYEGVEEAPLWACAYYDEGGGDMRCPVVTTCRELLRRSRLVDSSQPFVDQALLDIIWEDVKREADEAGVSLEGVER